MTHVTKKIVPRWYLSNGKSYGTRKAAYLAQAKRNLGHKVTCIIGHRHPFAEESEIEWVTEVFKELFPHDADGGCLRFWAGGSNGKWGECSAVFVGDTRTRKPVYPWCKTKWKAWLNAEAERLMKEDEVRG